MKPVNSVSLLPLLQGIKTANVSLFPGGSLRPEHAHQLIPIVADRGVSPFLRSPGISARTPVLRSSSLLGGGRLDRLVGIAREKAVGVHVLASSHAGSAAPPPLFPGRSQLPSESRCERLE